jgi:hypothetical protein
MNVLQLLDEVRRRVPEGAPFGTRCKLACRVTTSQGVHEAAAAARIDARGHRREQFWCDGLRVERAILLRLTCAEGECPHAKQVRAQWAEFRGRSTAVAPPRPEPNHSLVAEVAVTWGHQRLTARPARFSCFTPCPHHAHPPLTIEKTGFDLFDDGVCIGGGVTESGGIRRPRIPTVSAAEAYLLARQLETLAALGAARDSAHGRQGGRAADAG